MKFKLWLEKAEMIPVKNVRQSHDYDCGAAALKSVAHLYGISLENEREFIKLCNTSTKDGTPPENIVDAAKILGLESRLYNHMSIEQLKSLLDKKIPVICAIQAYGNKKDYDGSKNGHYVIAIGYDENNIYFEDPSLRMSRGHISIKEFMERWHDKEARTNKPQIRMGIVVKGNQKNPDLVGKTQKIV